MTLQNLGDIREGREEKDRFIGLLNWKTLKLSRAVTSCLGVWVLSNSGVVQRKQEKGPTATQRVPRSRVGLEQAQFAFLPLQVKDTM